MYDINKRKELKNAKVKDILEILKELPEDAEVCFNGDSYGYIHIEKDLSVVSFDDSALDDDYYYDGQMNEKYGIDDLHRQCYKANHETSKGICDNCSSHNICLTIKEKEDLLVKNDCPGPGYENVYGQWVPKEDHSDYENAVFNGECN